MVPTSEEFADAIRAARPSPIELAMLQWHYKAPEMVLTTARMSELMEWSRQSANEHYGEFAGRVASHLAWEPNDDDGYWLNKWDLSFDAGSNAGFTAVGRASFCSLASCT